VVELFNDFFVTMADRYAVSTSDLQSLNFHDVPYVTHTFHFRQVTENEVESIITSLRNKFSCGHDDIPVSLIKEVKHLIVKPLTHVVNSSLISGLFPDSLKIARVRPVFKKGDQSDVSCHRPVSILPAFSKIYERVVYLQLFDYLEVHNLIDRNQHGFRPGRSISSAGVEFIEHIIDSVDKGNITIGVFMDLTKAFDSVSHEVLLKVLSLHGVEKRELQWFQSYLQGRSQYVEVLNNIDGCVLNVSSSLREIKYGVPQGSILGPLLFLVYLKGLPNVLHPGDCFLTMYADDLNFVFSNELAGEIEISSLVNLSMVKDYLNRKNLLINTHKTKFIEFSTKQKKQLNPTIAIDQEVLEKVTNTIFLGLHIDQNLSWNEHVNSVLLKMSSGLYALRRLSQICSQGVLKLAYFALIHSTMAYGIVIYGSCSYKNMKKILTMQKKAVRVVSGLRGRESARLKFVQLNILTVFNLYIFETIKLVKQTKVISHPGKCHNYNTRHHNIIGKHRLEFYKKKPSYMGLKFLNYIPNEIKNIHDYNKFCKRLKEFLVSHPYYSLDEFYHNCQYM
jgi:hypothetical protein